MDVKNNVPDINYIITQKGIIFKIGLSLREMEMVYIQTMLDRHKWDKEMVSKILEISLRRLNGKIKKWRKYTENDKRETSLPSF